MRRRACHIAALAMAGCAAAVPATAQEAGMRVPVPSGQEVRFVEMRRDADPTLGDILRLRFLAPAIARDTGTIDQETAAADMEALCSGFALDRLPEGDAPDQIVISLSDRPVDFGEPAPGATQYFEAFTVEDGACVWAF